MNPSSACFRYVNNQRELYDFQFDGILDAAADQSQVPKGSLHPCKVTLQSCLMCALTEYFSSNILEVPGQSPMFETPSRLCTIACIFPNLTSPFKT